ncbi:hypothetical protein AGMMS49944_07270 [Spirochaetia bacterium]|nr:hypothetical protein AGMMS49944_07270 [Spirochaetia bacterium]
MASKIDICEHFGMGDCDNCSIADQCPLPEAYGEYEESYDDENTQ